MNRLISIPILALALAGCHTPTGEPDLVKTQQVKDSLRPLIQEAVTRIIRNSPEHSDQLATYFRAVGTVFCKMRDTGNFDPNFLASEIDKATAGLQAGLPQLALTAKNTAHSLYTIFFNQRLQAELPADRFMWNVSDLFCASIGTGLTDADKPGIEPLASLLKRLFGRKRH